MPVETQELHEQGIGSGSCRWNISYLGIFSAVWCSFGGTDAIYRTATPERSCRILRSVSLLLWRKKRWSLRFESRLRGSDGYRNSSCAFSALEDDVGIAEIRQHGKISPFARGVFCCSGFLTRLLWDDGLSELESLL